jgi:hypothetical protein
MCCQVVFVVDTGDDVKTAFAVLTQYDYSNRVVASMQ